MNLDKLYDYQEKGVAWGKSARDNGFGFSCPPNHGIIADEMGLGKTAQALMIVKDLVLSGKRGLFLVPGSTILQWQRQFNKWILDGEKDEWGSDELLSVRASKDKLSGSASYVISHALLAKKVVVEKLAAANFDFIVIDEIHKFGAVSSKRLTHLWALINMSANHFQSGRIGLTGTPVRNYAKEIYNLAHFIDPLRFRTREDFSRKYLTYDQKALYNPHQFHADFGPYYLRRMESEVKKDMPELLRTKLYTEITNKAMVQMYNKELDLLTNFMNNGDSLSSFSLLGYLIRLRHLTGVAKAAEPSIVEPIYEYIMGEGTESGEKKKVVIGIHHHLVARRLKNSILGNCRCGLARMAHFDLDDDYNDVPIRAKNGCEKWVSAIPFYELVGGQTQWERENIKQAFIADKAPSICLLSIKAAGEGVDGLQYAATKAYVFERQWNPADESQFEKRIHRTGQTEKCHIEYTIATGTIDEFFDALVEEKRRYTVQVEDEKWESNPAFLKKLAEMVIASRLPTPYQGDLEEFDRIAGPKKDIDEKIMIPEFGL